jgi:hypothetical protein
VAAQVLRPPQRSDRIGVKGAQRNHTRARFLNPVTEHRHPDVVRRQQRLVIERCSNTLQAFGIIGERLSADNVVRAPMWTPSVR